MRSLYAIIVSLLFITCQSDKREQIQGGQSRIEQIKKRPYRNLVVNENLERIIISYIEEVLNEISTLEEQKLFYVTDNHKIIPVKKNWDSARHLIDASHEIWKNDDILATIAIYPSFSQNATTADEEKIYVIEVEHKELTGTCRMFFGNPQQKKLTGLVYTDRN